MRGAQSSATRTAALADPEHAALCERSGFCTVEGLWQRVRDAVTAALQLVEGTYGIAVMHSDDPQKIVGARLGSPLVVGVGDGLAQVLHMAQVAEPLRRCVADSNGVWSQGGLLLQPPHFQVSAGGAPLPARTPFCGPVLFAV